MRHAYLKRIIFSKWKEAIYPDIPEYDIHEIYRKANWNERNLYSSSKSTPLKYCVPYISAYINVKEIMKLFSKLEKWMKGERDSIMKAYRKYVNLETMRIAVLTSMANITKICMHSLSIMKGKTYKYAMKRNREKKIAQLKRADTSASIN